MSKLSHEVSVTFAGDQLRHLDRLMRSNNFRTKAAAIRWAVNFSARIIDAGLGKKVLAELNREERAQRQFEADLEAAISAPAKKD